MTTIYLQSKRHLRILCCAHSGKSAFFSDLGVQTAFSSSFVSLTSELSFTVCSNVVSPADAFFSVSSVCSASAVIVSSLNSPDVLSFFSFLSRTFASLASKAAFLLSLSF